MITGLSVVALVCALVIFRASPVRAAETIGAATLRNADGTGSSEIGIDRIQTGELFNRVVILHAGADNFADVPLGDLPTQYNANAIDATSATRNTGNAGDRFACGVVEVTR